MTGLTNGTNGNIIGIDPKLGPLQDNGGKTWTHALLPGSPAIDAGNNLKAVDASGNSLLYDQRGEARIYSTSVDIGAVEWGGFVVTTLDDADDRNDGLLSLREAIALASGKPGKQRITFAPGLAGGTIMLNGAELLITDDLEILGPGAGRVTIDANQQSRVFRIQDSTVTLVGLTITGGYVIGDDYTAENGGGIYCIGPNSALTITDCTISGNTADGFGGGVCCIGPNSTLTITDSTISGNTAYDNGGGTYCTGTNSILTITDSTISGNTAYNGGGIYCIGTSSTLTVTDSTISGNTVYDGGGIYCTGTNSTLTLTGSTISGNTVNAFGGGIYNRSGISTLTNCTISGNNANGGGGIFNYSSSSLLTLTNCTVAENTANLGGGLYGSATLNNTIVANNITPSIIIGRDVYGTLDAAGANNLIGVDLGTGLTNGTNGNIIGTAKDYQKTFRYDANSQVTSIVQQRQAGGNSIASKRVEYTYNVANQVTTKTMYAATGMTSKVFDTAFTYDGMGRLTKLTHENGATVYADYTLTWDAASRITNFDFTYLNGSTAKTGIYGYDNTDQLTTATYNGFQSNENYGYDSNGNRSTNNFKVGLNNRLTNDGTFSYTYDNEGNRLTKTANSGGAVTTYTWDHRNRLTQVATPTATVTYAYDHLNRMIRRGSSEMYIHDGWQVVLRLNTSGIVQRRFFWGATQDELIAEEPGSTPIWTLCDHLGSVRDVINTAGTVLNHIVYNAFGKLINKTSTTNVPTFRYTGKLTDDTTDLQWNINRWYDASVGRWMSEDPMGFDAGDVNLYRYVGNNTTSCIDIFGMWKYSPGDGKYIFVSDKEGDTLQSLAEYIRASEGDWVCLWPIADPCWEKSYPNAFIGAKVDISNLRTFWREGSSRVNDKSWHWEQGQRLRMVANPNDLYREHLKILFETYKGTSYGTTFSSPNNFAGEIMKLSKQGENPIGYLGVGSHSNSSTNGTLLWNNDGTPFDEKSLFNLPEDYEKDNSTNHYPSAVKHQGPPLCWFTRDARVDLIGCSTTSFAKSFAKETLRKTALARGTKYSLVTEKDTLSGKTRRRMYFGKQVIENENETFKKIGDFIKNYVELVSRENAWDEYLGDF